MSAAGTSGVREPGAESTLRTTRQLGAERRRAATEARQSRDAVERESRVRVSSPRTRPSSARVARARAAARGNHGMRKVVISYYEGGTSYLIDYLLTFRAYFTPTACADVSPFFTPLI